MLRYRNCSAALSYPMVLVNLINLKRAVSNRTRGSPQETFSIVL